MLQQTRVAAALPYFRRFMRRFPDVRALAAAELEDVLGLWAGLGYYRRACHLHRAARIIVRGGGFPPTLEGWLALPGVGRYTAGAILSIAFNRPAAVLDGNVTRVLCRLFAIGGDAKRPANQRRLWRLAERLVDPRHPSQFNQALMELGSLVCTPNAPDCPRCPLRRDCRAFHLGRPEVFPRRGPKRVVRRERWAVALLLRDGGVLMTRRPATGRWAGLWEFPGPSVAGVGNARRSLSSFLRDRIGCHPLRLAPVGQVRHPLSHRDLTVEVFKADLAASRVAAGRDAAWVRSSAVRRRPVSALTRKIAERFLGE